MNILHLKYAVEVAQCGSINKAAENLYIAQPNLSRAVRELEGTLGITIFKRTSKGMSVTPEGEEFLNYARSILKQVEEVEAHYQKGAPVKQRFSISVPRASYISAAFSAFSLGLDGEPAEIFYCETNAMRAVENILQSDYRLGIIRYAENYDKYFKAMLAEKGLAHELIIEFSYGLIASRKSPLCACEAIHYSDLRPLIEIAHADPYVPALPLADVKRAELPEDISRRIFVFERGSQFELLAENPQTFMWVSPIPEKMLARYELSQMRCVDNQRVYRDLLIYRKDYRLSRLDKLFITELCKSKRQAF